MRYLCYAGEGLEDAEYIKCFLCGSSLYTDLHHWHGRKYEKKFGKINDILVFSVLPLCKKCHDKDLRGEEMLKEAVRLKKDPLILAAMYQSYYAYNRAWGLGR